MKRRAPTRQATPQELADEDARHLRARQDAACRRCGAMCIDRRWAFCGPCRRRAVELGVVPSDLPPVVE